MPRGGDLTLGQYVSKSISDTGTGMSPKSETPYESPIKRDISSTVAASYTTSGP